MQLKKKSRRKMSKFRGTYFKVEDLIKKDSYLINDVILIALLGSAADKEESSVWSDLDILVVLKTNQGGSISIENYTKLRQMAEKVSKDVDFPVSILPHSLDDFKNYVAFEYLKHYSLGECTYPSPDKLQEVISSVLEKRNVSNEVRQNYCLYHLRHIRFNLMRKYASINKHNNSEPNKEFLKLLIDKMIKVTDLALNFNDYWPKTKQGIYETSKEKLNYNNEVLGTALELRHDWGNVTEPQAIEFIPRGISYVYQVFDHLLGENSHSTPEEQMTK